MAEWLWQEVIGPSWLSLASAPSVIVAYWLLGQRRRAGWWWLIASQVGLLAMGVVHHEWALAFLIAPTLIGRAFWSWRSWGHADPHLSRLERELAAAAQAARGLGIALRRPT